MQCEEIKIIVNKNYRQIKSLRDLITQKQESDLFKVNYTLTKSTMYKYNFVMIEYRILLSWVVIIL